MAERNAELLNLIQLLIAFTKTMFWGNSLMKGSQKCCPVMKQSNHN